MMNSVIRFHNIWLQMQGLLADQGRPSREPKPTHSDKVASTRSKSVFLLLKWNTLEGKVLYIKWGHNEKASPRFTSLNLSISGSQKAGGGTCSWHTVPCLSITVTQAQPLSVCMYELQNAEVCVTLPCDAAVAAVWLQLSELHQNPLFLKRQTGDWIQDNLWQQFGEEVHMDVMVRFFVYMYEILSDFTVHFVYTLLTVNPGYS